MAAHKGYVNAVMLGVGAAFDFLAGTKPQAPAWMQRAGLEWLFRWPPNRAGSGADTCTTTRDSWCCWPDSTLDPGSVEGPATSRELGVVVARPKRSPVPTGAHRRNRTAR